MRSVAVQLGNSSCLVLARLDRGYFHWVVLSDGHTNRGAGLEVGQFTRFSIARDLRVLGNRVMVFVTFIAGRS